MLEKKGNIYYSLPHNLWSYLQEILFYGIAGSEKKWLMGKIHEILTGCQLYPIYNTVPWKLENLYSSRHHILQKMNDEKWHGEKEVFKNNTLG